MESDRSNHRSETDQRQKLKSNKAAALKKKKKKKEEQMGGKRRCVRACVRACVRVFVRFQSFREEPVIKTTDQCLGERGLDLLGYS